MTQFNYLLNKILETEIDKEPFEHIIIDDFFNAEHFEKIQKSEQIKLKEQQSNKDLLLNLAKCGFRAIPFPGSITNEKEYLKFLTDGKYKRSNIKGYGTDVIEGYGITYRLKKIEDTFLIDLMNFFESKSWLDAIADKFMVTDSTSYEGGIQKNLKGYEISPHPDTSRKALTWMVNIYTNSGDVTNLDMHTHLCEFKPPYDYIEKFWANNDVDPCWVPWDWANTVKKTNTNNSISIFRPSTDTLHAVRVNEDHLIDQRNQIYGNLWYDKPKKRSNLRWQDLDLLTKTRAKKRFFNAF